MTGSSGTALAQESAGPSKRCFRRTTAPTRRCSSTFRVERYFISRRYRVGAVTIGPQLSVDAAERQITMDRSLQSLPPSLQAVTLYEAKGELIDAAGGVLEFSDLLKRPLDAFKYLQLSIETG